LHLPCRDGRTLERPRDKDRDLNEVSRSFVNRLRDEFLKPAGHLVIADDHPAIAESCRELTGNKRQGEPHRKASRIVAGQLTDPAMPPPAYFAVSPAEMAFPEFTSLL
jgi:hypothetical protein